MLSISRLVPGSAFAFIPIRLGGYNYRSGHQPPALGGPAQHNTLILLVQQGASRPLPPHQEVTQLTLQNETSCSETSNEEAGGTAGWKEGKGSRHFCLTLPAGLVGLDRDRDHIPRGLDSGLLLKLHYQGHTYICLAGKEPRDNIWTQNSKFGHKEGTVRK